MTHSTVAGVEIVKRNESMTETDLCWAHENGVKSTEGSRKKWNERIIVKFSQKCCFEGNYICSRYIYCNVLQIRNEISLNAHM